MTDRIAVALAAFLLSCQPRPAATPLAPTAGSAPPTAASAPEAPTPAVAPPPVGSEPLRCQTADDCTVGFFEREIESAADCGCRVCPGVVMNEATAQRHVEQFDQHCPDFEANHRCAKAKCPRPPELECVAGACRARE
jgi:hypothetical protein